MQKSSIQMDLGSECGVQNRVDQGFYLKIVRVSVAFKSTKPETGETDDLAVWSMYCTYRGLEFGS